jgi:hypothetical protein
VVLASEPWAYVFWRAVATVPNLVNLSLSACTEPANAAGLNLTWTALINDDCAFIDTVKIQDSMAGTNAPIGSPVSVVIGGLPDDRPSPSLIQTVSGHAQRGFSSATSPELRILVPDWGVNHA